MSNKKSYFILSEREFSLNEQGLCVCCHSPAVEPIVDYDIDIDPESGLCSGSIHLCGWEYACDACQDKLAEAGIVIWDKPEAPPAALPFQMMVMLKASEEHDKLNDALPF